MEIAIHSIHLAEGHIPGAISTPLFDDNQRANIGKLYKGEGKTMAIELGKTIVQPRLAYLTQLVLPYKDCQIRKLSFLL